jgi:hypothetical protein
VREVNQSIWRKPCPSAALSTVNLNRTGPGSNAGLKSEFNPLNYIYRSSPYVPHRAQGALPFEIRIGKCHISKNYDSVGEMQNFFGVITHFNWGHVVVQLVEELRY